MSRPPATGSRTTGKIGQKTNPKARFPQPTLEERAERALDELQKLCLAVAQQMQVRLESDEGPVEMMIPVELLVAHNHADRGHVQARERLLTTVRTLVEETARGLVAFALGRVYCFQCDTIDCAHSQPPDPIYTFAGYTATGKPEWQTFVSLCLSRKETRVDQLFAKPAEIIGIVQMADELAQNLLPKFGKNSLAFSVLGQCVIGLIPVALDTRSTDPKRNMDTGFNHPATTMPPVDKPDLRRTSPVTMYADQVEVLPTRKALTLQIVETQVASAARRLRLNIIGFDPHELAAYAGASPHRGPAESIRRTIGTLREKIDTLGRKSHIATRKKRTLDLNAEVSALLNGTRSDLERVFRSALRRTEHATQRHLDGERPTGNAIADALAAPTSRFFWDADKQTVVVIGPRGRTHVFANSGKLVTSLQLDKSQVEKRLEKKRWTPLDKEAIDSLREVVKK